MIPAFLLSHWKEIGGAALVLALVFAVGFLYRKTIALSIDNGRLSQKIEQCRVIEEEQARARAEWKQKMAEAETRRQTAEAKAANVRVVHDVKIREVLTAPIAAGCEGAIQFLRDQGKGLGAWE